MSQGFGHMRGEANIRTPFPVGLLFGMYSDARPQTCAGYPGSRGHEVDDANSFAEWEADYLKAGVRKP